MKVACSKEKKRRFAERKVSSEFDAYVIATEERLKGRLQPRGALLEGCRGLWSFLVGVGNICVGVGLGPFLPFRKLP